MYCVLFLVALFNISYLDGEPVATFSLRTRSNPSNAKFVYPLNKNDINVAKPVKFLAHGWQHAGNKPVWDEMANAFLKAGDYNVVVVDWSKLAAQNYPLAVRDIKRVGDAIGNEIVALHKQKKAPLANFQVVGHSLGAHIAGFAGKSAKRLTGSKISRITGLDPAGPLFEVPPVPKNSRLSDEDANVVEALHTNGGMLGYLTPLGTIDFFANGGDFIQKECQTSVVNASSAVLCSHIKGLTYYTRAIRNGGITATECGSWQKYQSGACNGNQKESLGVQLPKHKGKYYFKISD